MELKLETLLAAIQGPGVDRLRETFGLDAAQASGAVEAAASSVVDQVSSAPGALGGLLSGLAGGGAGDLLGGLVDPSAMASAVAERTGVGAEAASGIVQALLPLFREALGGLLSGGSGLGGLVGGLFGD